MSTTTDRRGENLAIWGGLLSAATFVTMFVLGARGESVAVVATGWLALGTVGIWIVTWAQLHQQRLFEEERFELDQLERERQEKLGGAKSIFDETDLDQMDAMVMGRRLRTMEKWFVPFLALGTALFLLLVGVWMMPWSGTRDWIWPLNWLTSPFKVVANAIQNNRFIARGETAGIAATLKAQQDYAMILAGLGAIFCFVSFMMSRAALGMARIRELRQLRGAGNAMFGITIATFIVLAAFLGRKAIAESHYFDLWAAHAIGAVMIILGVEIFLNFIFDLYRPRVADAQHRAFYDSRVLGMFSEPGGVLASLADALDYQFGFKVSDTWFFQLLRRWVLPLLFLQAGVIWLLTMPVVVPQGSEAVVEHFRPFGGSKEPTVVQSGLTLTWPWPFDRASIIKTSEIQQFEIGYKRDTHVSAEPQPQLWTKKHRGQEYELLVPSREQAADETLPLNLFSVTVPIQFRVKPGATLAYFKQAKNSARIVEATAYRVLTRFAARSDVTDLLSDKSADAADRLREEMQAALDHAGIGGSDLGVLVTNVSLANIHPVTEAAEAFEDTVSAIQRSAAAVRRAEGNSAASQLESGGLQYEEIYAAIVAEEAAERDLQAAVDAGGDLTAARAAVTAATAKVESMLDDLAGGQARQIVSYAQQEAYGRAVSEEADAALYAVQVASYRLSPRIYALRQYLATLESALAGVRKYIIAIEDADRVIVQLDEESRLSQDLIQNTMKAMRDAP